MFVFKAVHIISSYPYSCVQFIDLFASREIEMVVWNEKYDVMHRLRK